MRRIFSSKKNKNRINTFFLFFFLSLGFFISYKKIEVSRVKITNKEFVQFITNNTFNSTKYSFLESLVNKTMAVYNPLLFMNRDYQDVLNKTQENMVNKEEKTPIIYLYNTHQTEEYASSSFLEFTVNPTVIINNYILEDVFEKNGYSVVVEESSISDILKNNSWNYAKSYQASRLLMEEKKIIYPTLKYFIDIHRDSLKRDKTTITIDNKEYAKLLFLIGLENKDYQKNLSFTEEINAKINEYYPNLSKGIYKKGGYGVNGVYNQDFSPYTILIEVGGYENTTDEVLNSILAFARCFMEVINEKDF